MQFFIILLLSVVSLCRTAPLKYEAEQNFTKIIRESLGSLQNVAVDKQTEDLWFPSPTDDVNEKSMASYHHEVFLKGLRTINTDTAKLLVKRLELLPDSCPILQGHGQTTPGLDHTENCFSDFIGQLKTFLEMLNREGCHEGSKTH